jgi:hypothetical protein
VVEEGERQRGRRNKRVRFGAEGGHRRSSKWRSIRESSRSSDGGSVNAGEDSGADGVGQGSCGGGEQWYAVRVNPNRPIARPPFILPPQTLKPLWSLIDHMGHWLGHSSCYAPLWAARSVPGPISFMEIGPLLFLFYLFSV